MIKWKESYKFVAVRYFMDISYRGTNFNGWQIQPNGITVQEEVEKALSTILKSKTPITGSGRTDTGVHASHQIAHFDADELDPVKLVFKLNSFLNGDISVNEIKPVKNDVSARFEATHRTYHYHIHQAKNPFKKGVSYYYHPQLNVEKINSACEIIKKWQNFECFSKVHTEVNNFNCQIFEAKWVLTGSDHLFEITANRFLRGMVRAVVGTLIDVGLGKKSLNSVRDILESNDRQKAGRAVPAEGLFLQEVVYPKEIYLD
ncbi:tRNA pseudouridine(38-40) synthase TruA [Ekhidna sp.]